MFPIRTVLLANTLVFEVGSAICGAAPTSVAFIVGRAVCGVGAAGLFAGTIACIIDIVPLHQRPKIQGMFGAVFGIASILGPLVGGAFTSNVTWRWCFYVNLPIGGVAMVVIAVFLKVPDREATKLPLADKIRQLDLLGTCILVPGVVCLLLALQWGGPEYPVSGLAYSIRVCLLEDVLLTVWAVERRPHHCAADPCGRSVGCLRRGSSDVPLHRDDPSASGQAAERCLCVLGHRVHQLGHLHILYDCPLTTFSVSS